MKFKNKKLLEKSLIVMCIMIILFNFIIPIKSKANDAMEKAGGVLFEPIKDFLTSVSDAILWIMQYAFYQDTDHITYESIDSTDPYVEVPYWVEGTEESKIRISETVGAGIFFGVFELPKIRISPEAIFSNKVPAFDINFFNPNSQKYEINESNQITYYSFVSKYIYIKPDADRYEDLLKERVTLYHDFLRETCFLKICKGIDKDKNGKYIPYERYRGTQNYNYLFELDQTELDRGAEEYLAEFDDMYNEAVEDDHYAVIPNQITTMMCDDTIDGVNHGADDKIDAETLQELDRIGNLNITTVSTKELKSSAEILQPVVSYWYNVLRNISVIGLLSVLLYLGIKIVTSSLASQKSKYKEMLKDWLVALLLLFFMHYFMSLVVTITTSVSSAIVGNASDVHQTTIGTGDETETITYFGDKLIGEARIRLQLQYNFSEMLAYTVIYVVLVIYTLIFSVIYLKRVIYMAFFTMIAPLVALTYPLDKVKDGKAQAFDYWMKEYVFNALIQPVHLILYYVLVGSSLELAKENPIYALVAIGFIMPADKIIRKFFGFDKASTAGVLGGALSGALAVQGFNAIKKRLAGGSNGKGKEEKEKKDKPIRTADSGNNTGKLMSDIAGGNAEEANQNGQEEQTRIREQRERAFQEEQAQNGQGQGVNGRDINQNNEEENGQTDEEQNNGGQNTQANEESDAGKAAKAKALTVAKIAGKGLKFAGKTLLRGYGAATLGTLGIAAGLASEKYSNVFSYGLGGAAAGKMAADAGMKFVGKTLPSTAYRIKKGYEGIRDESEKQIYTKKERAKIANERADNAFRRDPDAKKQFKHAFGKDNYEAAMEAAISYRRYGITDNDTIIKAMQLSTQGLGSLDDKKRILAAKLAPQVKNEKDIEQIEGRLRANGFTNDQIENMKEAIRRYNDMG